MIFDKLYFRHWDEYDNHKYSDIFMMKFGRESQSLDFSSAIDLMADSRFSCPIQPFGDLSDFSINPKSKKLAFSTMQDFDRTIQAFSTNTNIFLVDWSKGNFDRICITCENFGANSRPSFSPDGSKLAYLEMRVPKFEVDKNRLVYYNSMTSKIIDLTDSLDLSVDSFQWIDGDNILFLAGEKGYTNIYRVSLSTLNVEKISSGGVASNLLLISSSKFSLVFSFS
jgi:Tol biopolymer transport system component